MRALAAWRALARGEWREIRRHRARSWLVILLVAVPTAALVAGSALLETTRRTPDEERATVFGSADLRIDGASGDIGAELAALSSGAVRVAYSRADVSVPGIRVAASAIDVAPGALDPGGLAVGLARVTRGRAPNREGEIALSPALAARLGVGVDGAVAWRDASHRVTGLVVDPEHLDRPLVVTAGAASDAAPTWLVSAPMSARADIARRARESGLGVRDRSAEDLAEPDSFETLVVFVVGGFAFFEAALVIGAAFAVGLRRRRREIGLLAATGASRGDLRAAVIASALACALIGVAIGFLVGIAGAHAAHPFLDGWNRRLNGPLEWPWPSFFGAAALGIFAAVAAAAVPAWSASNLAIRAALSGRRPASAESARRSLVFGLVLSAAGVGCVLWGAHAKGPEAALAILGGSASGVLGLGAGTPWMLGALARRASILPVAWRLAVRDAGRFRSRNGPVVTAVLAGLSVGVLLASLASSIDALLAGNAPALRDDHLRVDGPNAEETARAIGREIGAVALAPMGAARANDGSLVRVHETGNAGDTWLAVGEAELLQALGARGAPSHPFATFRASPGEIEIFAGERRLSVGAPSVVALERRLRAPSFVLSHAESAALGLSVGPPPGADSIPWIVRSPIPIDVAALARAQVIASFTPGSSVDAAAGGGEPAYGYVRLALGFCFAVGLTVVFIATALSSAESADDARVLAAVGAPPRILRRLTAARAAHLALLGCVLAVPAGLIPSYGIVALSNLPLEFALPWRELALVVFVFPTLAYVGAWIVSRSREGDAPCFDT